MSERLLESIIESAYAYRSMDKPIDVAILAFVSASVVPVSVDEIVSALPWKKTEVYERLTVLHSKRIVEKGERVRIASVGGRIALDWGSKIKMT